MLFVFISVILYEISVYTGSNPGAETNSNVYITVFGSRGDSGKRKLQTSRTSNVKFQRGQVKKTFEPLLSNLLAINVL